MGALGGAGGGGLLGTPQMTYNRLSLNAAYAACSEIAPSNIWPPTKGELLGPCLESGDGEAHGRGAEAHRREAGTACNLKQRVIVRAVIADIQKGVQDH